MGRTHALKNVRHVLANVDAGYAAVRVALSIELQVERR